MRMVKLKFSIFCDRNKLLTMQYIVSVAICILFCSSPVSTSNHVEYSRFLRQNDKGSSALQQVANDFSMLSRLVNGIALQEGFSDGSAKPDDVIAELLNIESGETVRGLQEMSFDTAEISSKLNTMAEEVSKLGGNALSDSSQVKAGVEALSSMKGFEEDLEKGTTPDLGKEFRETSEEINTENFYTSPVPLSDFEEIAGYFKLISTYEKPSDDLVVKSDYTSALKKLVKVGDKLNAVIDHFKNYQTLRQFAPFWPLKGKYKVLDPISKISEAGQKYASHWGTLSSLSTKMASLKTDADILSPLIKQHEFHSTVSKSLEPVTVLVEALFTHRQSPKSLTEGFPNGPQDLSRVKLDLKQKWLSEKIANGIELTKLSPLLTKIQKISDPLIKLNEEFVSFKKSNDILSSPDDFLSVFEVLAKDGKELEGTNDLDSSMNTLTEATKDLKAIQGNPPFQDFDELYENVAQISNYITSFEEAFIKMSKIGYDNTDKLITKIIGLAKEATNKTGVTDKDVFGAVKKIKEHPGFENLCSLTNIAATKLKPLLSNEFANVFKERKRWDSIGTVQKSLEGTGLPEALKALSASQPNFSVIDKMLSYGIKVREITKDKIQSIQSILAFIEKLKVGTKNVMDVAGAKPKHRRDAEGKPKKVEISKSLASDLAKEVNHLRELSKVYEKRSLISKISENPPEVNRVISKLPALKNSWIDANLEMLKKLPAELEALEKFTKENKDGKDLIELGSIFEKASNIKGASIDSKLFKDIVVPALQQSSSPVSINAAPDFLELSELELDYSKQSLNIKAAPLTFLSLRQYFDDVFGITRTAPPVEINQKETIKTGVSTGTLVIIGLAILAAGGIAFVIIRGVRNYKNARKFLRRLNDPETWVHLSYTRDNESIETPKPHLPWNFPLNRFLVEKNYEAFKKCLHHGAYVNSRSQHFDFSNSPLHEAVQWDKPKCIEQLIKHGANVNILNHEFETPVQMAKRMKKKKCIAVFKKYEKKSFNIVLPEPFQKDRYAIKVCPTIKKEEYHHNEFHQKFAHNWAEKEQRPSHIVVKTDKKNILHVEKHHLPMIFSASMLMGHRWMKASVDRTSKLDNNNEFRVTKLDYQGKIYESVLEIKDHFNRRKVPYLFGVKIFFNNYILVDEWSIWFQTVRQLGVDLKTSDFPYFSNKDKTMYHRDDWPTNMIVFNPKDRAQVKNNYKELWKEHPEFFLDTIELTHFLLEFKIKSKKLDEAEKKKKGGTKTNGKKKDKKKLKKKKNKDESEDSNSGPENSDSGPSTMTKAQTPQAGTPGSRTRTQTPGTTTTNTVTPTSRTPGTTRRH